MTTLIYWKIRINDTLAQVRRWLEGRHLQMAIEENRCSAGHGQTSIQIPEDCVGRERDKLKEANHISWCVIGSQIEFRPA